MSQFYLLRSSKMTMHSHYDYAFLAPPMEDSLMLRSHSSGLAYECVPDSLHQIFSNVLVENRKSIPIQKKPVYHTAQQNCNIFYHYRNKIVTDYIFTSVCFLDCNNLLRKQLRIITDYLRIFHLC